MITEMLLTHNSIGSTDGRGITKFSCDSATLKVPGSNPGVDDRLSSGLRGTEEPIEPPSV